MNQSKYKRILLKVSGEALMGEEGYGISVKKADQIAKEVIAAQEMGIQIAIVIGGGNIYRGLAGAENGIDRSTGDYMGMLATIMNALALQASLEKQGKFTRVLSALEIPEVAEPYIQRRAIRHLEKGRVIIFAAGTGNPYFTTDTAASLRAVEIHADVILKGTKVDGVYDSDPMKNPNAIRYDKVSFLDALNKRLGVMDSTSLSLCMDHELPIIVFDLFKSGNLQKLLLGENVGTLVE